MESLLADLTAYKNRNGGVRGRGELHVFRNLKAADNAIGFTNSTGSFGADTFTSLVVDSRFVGETDNIGNPVTPEEKAYGRSLPKRPIPDFPIRAYEYDDYRHDVVNTTFVNFQDNNQRGSGALSWLLFTGAGVTTENTVTSAKFVNAKPVYFPKIVTTASTAKDAAAASLCACAVFYARMRVLGRGGARWPSPSGAALISMIPLSESYRDHRRAGM